MRRGYGSYHRRNRKRVWIISILFVLCLALVFGYMAYENLIFTADGVQLSLFDSFFNKEEDKPEENPDEEVAKPTITTEAPEKTTQATQLTEAPKPQLPDLSAKCITHLERFALCCLRQGQESKTVLLEEKDRWKDSVLICDDISCGVVPLDAETRAWREACGRMLSALSMEAETVTRIFCGLPQRLK